MHNHQSANGMNVGDQANRNAVPAVKPQLQAVLDSCERFLLGFEDDSDQPQVANLLRDIRGLQASHHLDKQSSEQLEFVRKAVPLLRCLHASNSNELAAQGTRMLDLASKMDANREVATVILRGIDLATRMESFEDDTALLNTSVDVWLESALETTSDDVELASILDTGIAAVKAARRDEEQGLKQLMDWASASYVLLCQRQLVDTKPVAVVELSGGNCSNVSIRGDVSVVVLDYDNGEDDESEPEIPTKNCRASVASYSGTCNPMFCKQMLDVVHYII